MYLDLHTPAALSGRRDLRVIQRNEQRTPPLVGFTLHAVGVYNTGRRDQNSGYEHHHQSPPGSQRPGWGQYRHRLPADHCEDGGDDEYGADGSAGGDTD